jgi:uncharacterized protein YcnI
MPFTALPPTSTFWRLCRRVAVIGFLSASAAVRLAGTAFAHVTAQPGNAAQGSYTEVAFRTPNEEDNAAPVKLEVSLPTDHLIASVSIEPVPGWTATVDKTNLATPIKTDDGDVTQAVSKITWSGGQLAPASSKTSTSPSVRCRVTPTSWCSKPFRPTATATWSAGSKTHLQVAQNPSTRHRRSP